MIDILLIIPILVSFFLTLFLLPLWIKKAREIGLIWDDMNKTTKEKVAGSGGVIAVLGFVIAVMVFIAFRVFYIHSSQFLIETLAALTVILMLAGIGLIDDLFGWRKGGLSKKSRIFLVLLAAVPLMAINAGRETMSIPFAGQISLGIIYPIIFIPLGILGATTTYNFLAGYNGLEAGQGMIILIALAIVSYMTGNSLLAIILLCMVAALFAFLLYNFHPAKIFPGDSLTYAIGGIIAISAILGNFEKIAVFFFIPYIIECILKVRGKLIVHSFGKPLEDGSLDLAHDKICGLEHLSIYLMKKMKIKPTEKKVVYSIWAFQIILIIIGFIIFREGIFIHG